MTDESRTVLETTRRGALAGIGMVGVAAAVAACGGGSGGTSASGGPGPGGSSGGSSALGTTSEIPVGGGKIFTAEKVVVTQPTKGEFKGFSAICTHMGCTVDKIRGRHDRLPLPRQQVQHHRRSRRPRPGPEAAAQSARSRP